MIKSQRRRKTNTEEEKLKMGNDKNYQVGMVLDDLSLDELEKTIGILKGEISRLESELIKKSATLSAAEGAFKL